MKKLYKTLLQRLNSKLKKIFERSLEEVDYKSTKNEFAAAAQYSYNLEKFIKELWIENDSLKEENERANKLLKLSQKNNRDLKLINKSLSQENETLKILLRDVLREMENSHKKTPKERIVYRDRIIEKIIREEKTPQAVSVDEKDESNDGLRSQIKKILKKELGENFDERA